MDFEKELQRVAKQYEDEGYAVTIRPAADKLPPFAKGFAVDLLATRARENVLVSVKRDRAELEADPKVSRQAEVAGAQPGWRYDVVILEPSAPRRRPEYREPSIEQIERMLAEAEHVAGVSPRGAFVLAWAGLEAAMRRTGQRAGVGGGIGTQPLTLVRELYSSGRLSPEDFRRVEESRVMRTEVIHGLEPPAVNADAVRGIVALARKLLADSDKLEAVAG